MAVFTDTAKRAEAPAAGKTGIAVKTMVLNRGSNLTQSITTPTTLTLGGQEYPTGLG